MFFTQGNLLEKFINIYVRARCLWLRAKKNGMPKHVLDYYRENWRKAAIATGLTNKELGRQFRKRWVETDFQLTGEKIVDPIQRCEQCKYFIETDNGFNETLTGCRIFGELLAVCDKFEK